MAGSSKVFQVSRQSQKRIIPNLERSVEKHVPLSILDATVLTFSPTSAVWMYDPPSDARGQAAMSFDHLLRSLETTLLAYPQWAGQLQWMPYDPEGDHTQRYGRLKLVYGTNTDPGVEFVTAHCPQIMASIVPSAADRAAHSQGWQASQVPSAELLSETPLALHNLTEYIGLPCLTIQLTSFVCGGLAIAVKFAHAIADAQAMFYFMNDWAKVNRALLSHEQVPPLMPVFDPAILDNTAAGDIDQPTADSAIRDIARELPVHRFDCWASAEGSPEFLRTATQIPAALDGTKIERLGKPLRWSEWDASAPVDYYLIYFSPEELAGMWREATMTSTGHVSHLDAILSHMWILINRAKDLQQDEDFVYLDVTIGIRARLSPPLPDAFMGSPILLTNVTKKGTEASAPEAIGSIASTIRSFVSRFNAATLPALLHDVSYQDSGQRYWCAFFGKRNTIVTSWLQQDVYRVDFGGKGSARYVEAIMPNVDGCLHIMSAGLFSETNVDKQQSSINESVSATWYETGVNISLNLNSVAMQKLLKDPLLRKYRNKTAPI